MAEHHNLLSSQVIQGWSLQETPLVAGAPYDPETTMKAVIPGRDGAIRFDDELLSRNTLFVGAIGSGKTNAMMQLVQALRRSASDDDVFVVFDSKGDFYEEFYKAGDAVISNERNPPDGTVYWNLSTELDRGDDLLMGEQIFEISSTIFAEQMAQAGENAYFAIAARDVFAGVVEALLRTKEPGKTSNLEIRQALEESQRALWERLAKHADLAGAKRYLSGSGQGPRAVLAFMQQQVRAAFSGVFGQAGDFSVRQFVRQKSKRALFIEYDIASGGMLLPIYRTLVDLAIKEALGRKRSRGNVFFVLDEFALLPHLTHLTDGVNFGRSLGLKFIVGTQNTSQVEASYSKELAISILSGFGTVFCFRLMDTASRDYFRNRFGINQKQMAFAPPVATEVVRFETSYGHVVEDWDISSLEVGECLVALPTGPPFYFGFQRFEQS